MPSEKQLKAMFPNILFHADRKKAWLKRNRNDSRKKDKCWNAIMRAVFPRRKYKWIGYVNTAPYHDWPSGVPMN